jgi:hypothetical protein
MLTVVPCGEIFQSKATTKLALSIVQILSKFSYVLQVGLMPWLVVAHQSGIYEMFLSSL